MCKLPKIFRIILSAFILISNSFAIERFSIPSLDELKRLHIEGVNGEYNLEKLNSIYATGRILYYTDNETIEREFRIYKKRPNKYRSFFETNLDNKKVQLEITYDGDNAVKLFSHEGREVYRENLEGDELESIKFESKIDGPFLLLLGENKKYITIEGFDYIEGEKCILLSVDEGSKYPYRKIWLSAENFQEVKYDSHVIRNGEEQLEEVYYRNFKNIQGILFPSRTDKFINGKRNFTTFVDNFDVNYGLFDSLFDIE